MSTINRNRVQHQPEPDVKHQAEHYSARMLINGVDIRIMHATTVQIVRELTLNPDLNYQARGVRKPRKEPS